MASYHNAYLSVIMAVNFVDCIGDAVLQSERLGGEELVRQLLSQHEDGMNDEVVR